MSTPDPQTVREPLCDRIGRIAEQLEISATDLRGMPGVSRLRAALPEAVASLRSIADHVLEQGAELDDLRGDNAALLDGNQRLQTMNEGLRQMAIEAREVANSWQQATIDLYSGRGEAAPDVQQAADVVTAEQQQSFAADPDTPAGRIDVWLTAWKRYFGTLGLPFGADLIAGPPPSAEPRVSADDFGVVLEVLAAVLAERARSAAAEQQQDGAVLRNISELLSDENLDAHRISASVAAAIRELREQLAAATARAEKAEDEVERLRSLEDSYIVALDQMSIGDVQRLRERAEKAEALLAKLGEPAPEYGLQYGDADPQALRAQDEIAYYRGRRHSGLRVRDVYRAPWRVVADAAPEGLSGPVERSEVSGGHGEGSNVRAASGGRVDARTEGGRTSAQ